MGRHCRCSSHGYDNVVHLGECEGSWKKKKRKKKKWNETNIEGRMNIKREQTTVEEIK